MEMSLRLTDEYDPDDWDLYHGKGPMRTVMHYECHMCDKIRCHLAVEVADDGKPRMPTNMMFDRGIMMPCPLERTAVFEEEAGPEERGWAGTEYGTREEYNRRGIPFVLPVTHVEEPGGDRHFRERMDRWPGDECEEDLDESRE